MYPAWRGSLDRRRSGFFHDPQRDSARAAVAATRGLQSTRQARRLRVAVRGTMEAGKNSVICMGLISGPNKADDTCGKTTGTMERGSTVYCYLNSATLC